MERLSFEWDHKKAVSNQLKHRISFDEAATTFRDENAVEFYDPEHSRDEERFLMIGMSIKLRVLLVSYCFRKKESVIRIISARKATRKETAYYTKGA